MSKSKQKVSAPISAPQDAANLASQSQDTAEALINLESQLHPEPPTLDDVIQEALNRITSLEQLVIRMCHNAGVGHSIILKAGLKPYDPTVKDMSKYSG